jgi:hypothetical protein
MTVVQELQLRRTTSAKLARLQPQCKLRLTVVQNDKEKANRDKPARKSGHILLYFEEVIPKKGYAVNPAKKNPANLLMEIPPPYGNL